MLSSIYITLVLGKLCHVKQWPTLTGPLTPVIISLSIAKRDEYPCHAKQWPTPSMIARPEGNLLVHDIKQNGVQQHILLKISLCQ
jgi:hypothetical protein